MKPNPNLSNLLPLRKYVPLTVDYIDGLNGSPVRCRIERTETTVEDNEVRIYLILLPENDLDETVKYPIEQRQAVLTLHDSQWPAIKKRLGIADVTDDTEDYRPEVLVSFFAHPVKVGGRGIERIRD